MGSGYYFHTRISGAGATHTFSHREIQLIDSREKGKFRRAVIKLVRNLLDRLSPLFTTSCHVCRQCPHPLNPSNCFSYISVIDDDPWGQTPVRVSVLA